MACRAVACVADDDGGGFKNTHTYTYTYAQMTTLARIDDINEAKQKHSHTKKFS